VVYKETVATDSVLYLELLWPGGYTSLDAPTRPEQEVLAASLEQVSLGDLSPEALSCLLYQERISWLPIVEAGHHRLMLSCPAPKTTETLHFLHALLTEAHYDTLYIEQMRRDMLEELPKENVAASFCVDHQLRAAVDRDFTYGSPDRQAWSHLTASAVQTFYDTLFTAREGLQIVAVGPLGVDTLTSFLEATIGRCGLRRASELPLPAFRQLQGSKPDGQHEGNREFACYFMGYPMEQGLRGSLIVKLMQNLLLQQANRRIRNASGLVYSPYVTFIAPIREGGPYLVALRGTCAGKALDTALATARECFVQLASQPVSQVMLGQLQKTFLLNRADALGPLASAISWRDYLAEQLLAGITPEELDCYEAILQSITPDMLQQAFQQLVAQGMCGKLLE
jgi:hypothetical protein